MNADRSTNSNDAPEPHVAPAEPVAVDDDVTGLPGLRTWRAVYLFVVAVFVVYVVLLTALSRAFA